MNLDQVTSLIRTGMKIGGGLLLAHGFTDSAGVVNSDTVVSAIIIIISAFWSHFAHADDSNTTGGGTAKMALLAFLLLPALLFTPGCANLSSNAFTAEMAAASTSDAALKGYAAYWNQAIQSPTNYNRTVEGLNLERRDVEAASVKVGASIALTENLRSAYATNSAVKPQLQAALDALGSNSGNIINFVSGLINVSTNQ